MVLKIISDDDYTDCDTIKLLGDKITQT